jgi:hypothetical protein
MAEEPFIGMSPDIARRFNVAHETIKRVWCDV